MKNKFTKLISAVVLSTLLFTACATAPKGAMVKIGKEYITEEEITKEYNKIVESFDDEEKKKYDENAEEGKNNALRLKQNLLDNLTTQEIIKQKLAKIEQEYKKEGKSEEEIKKITVTDEDVDNQLKTIIENIGGEEKYKEELKKNKITEEDVKSQLKSKIYSQNFQEWFLENFKPSDEEIMEKYKGSDFEGPEISASHILLENEEDAKKVKERLEKGEEFEKVAKETSKDPTVSMNNGILGNFTKGVMVPEFYDAAVKLEIGKISDPVKSEFGYHIIKLTGKVNDYKDFTEEGKTRIKNLIQQEIMSQKYKDEFEKIKKEIGVLPIKNFVEK